MRQTTALDIGASRQNVERPLYVRLQHLLGRDWHVAYVFVLPTLLLLGGLIAYPFLKAVYLSFTNTVTLQTGPFVGLRNYQVLWNDSFFRGAVQNTIIYTVSSVFFKFWLGLSAALLVNRVKRFSGPLTGAFLVPWIVPSVVIALTWKSLLDPVYGGVNQFLIQTGMVDKGLPWFGSTQTAMMSLIMVNVWQGIPFFTVNLLAGLKAIDKEYYEAATIDGASGWRCFRHITLPGLRYVLIVVVLLSTIWTFNNFTEIFLLTGGGPVGSTASIPLSPGNTPSRACALALALLRPLQWPLSWRSSFTFWVVTCRQVEAWKKNPVKTTSRILSNSCSAYLPGPSRC